MQSIENLLSPAGQSVQHEFAFDSNINSGMLSKHQKFAVLDASSETKNFVKSAQIANDGTCNGARDSVGGGSEASNEYLLDEEMAEYDVDPLPLDVIMSHEASSTTKQAPSASEKGTRSRGIVIEQKSQWQKKDVVTKGQYKPWFFSRFAKSRIPLGKPQCLADLKSITNSCRNLKVKYDEGDKNGSSKGRRSKATQDDDGERTNSRRRRQKEEEYEEDEDEDEDGEEDEELWVECEKCGKWRKVPPGVEIDAEKSFFCQMLPSVTCDTPEEDWDEEETEWVEDQDTHDSGSGGGRNGASPHNNGGGNNGGGHNRGGGANASTNGAGSHGGGKSGFGEGQGSKKRKAVGGGDSSQCGSEASVGSPGRGGGRAAKARRHSPGSPVSGGSGDEPLSPEDITAASSLYGGGGGAGSQGMSRLAAVVRVLGSTGRAMHYDQLTRQALRLGLIRFTGSQGTAGESMKAFLNKTIRENKTAAVVNLGKGVYGLQEWRGAAAPGCPAGPRPSGWHAQEPVMEGEGRDSEGEEAAACGGERRGGPKGGRREGAGVAAAAEKGAGAQEQAGVLVGS